MGVLLVFGRILFNQAYFEHDKRRLEKFASDVAAASPERVEGARLLLPDVLTSQKTHVGTPAEPKRTQKKKKRGTVAEKLTERRDAPPSDECGTLSVARKACRDDTFGLEDDGGDDSLLAMKLPSPLVVPLKRQDTDLVGLSGFVSCLIFYLA